MNRAASGSIELVGKANDNGLAMMLSTLIGQNLTDRPELTEVMQRLRGRVGLVAEDAEVSLTLYFRNGNLRVFDGLLGRPDLTIRTGSDEIIALSLLESGRFGLPDPRGENNRKIMDAIRNGRLRIHGLLSHLPLLLRVSRLMEVGAQ